MPPHHVSLGSCLVSTPQSDTTLVTDHLALAAFLVSHGHHPTLASSRSGKVLFSFAATPALSAAVASFNDGNAQVEPAAYDAARVQLRKQMDALLGGVR
jgi:hypothetical protein